MPPGRATRPTSDRAREGLFGTVRAVLGPLDGCRVLDLYAGSGAVGLEALSRGAAHALLVESASAAVRVIGANIAAVGLPGAVVVADRVDRVLARGLAGLPGPVTGAAFLDGVGGARRITAVRPGNDETGPAEKGGRGQDVPPDADNARYPGAAGPGAGPANSLGYDFVFADPPYAATVGELRATLLALCAGGWLAPGALVAVERATGGPPLAWPPGYVADRVRNYGDTTLWYGLAAGV